MNREQRPPVIGDDQIKATQCAGCEKTLVLPSSWVLLTAEQRKRFQGCGTRIDGRTYCVGCADKLFPSTTPQAGVRYGPLDDGSPWQQNAVRDMEDAG